MAKSEARPAPSAEAVQQVETRVPVLYNKEPTNDWQTDEIGIASKSSSFTPQI